MKTIRNDVFETNSSSTHSITIQTIGARKFDKTPRPLVQDNVLYPNRLEDYTIRVETYDVGHITTCRTKDEKAALVACWISMLDSDNDISTEHFSDAINVLKNALGYDIISFDDSYSSFYSYDENGNNPLRVENEKIVGLEKLIDVILDDTKEIIESDMPY